MSAEKHWRLVCYDVRDKKRYRRVYKIIKGVGRAVQYSVFRCRMDAHDVERLRWDLAKVMAPEDSLLIVDLCPTCAGNVISRNHVEGWTHTPSSFVIVGGRETVDRDQASSGVSASTLRTSAKLPDSGSNRSD